MVSMKKNKNAIKQNREIGFVKHHMIIIILAILLIITIAYIAADKYTTHKATQESEKLKQEQELYLKGLNDGYERAVLEMFKKTSQCAPIPLQVANNTLNIIAMECLQKEEVANE